MIASNYRWGLAGLLWSAGFFSSTIGCGKHYQGIAAIATVETARITATAIITRIADQQGQTPRGVTSQDASYKTLVT